MKNPELPLINSDVKPLDFELDKSIVFESNDSSASTSYGLIIRENNRKIDNSNANSCSLIDATMIREFKTDLETLPEEQGFDEYDDKPVDGFGEALLTGFGWRKGRGIGRNVRKDVKVIDYKKRIGKERLGFMADHPPVAKFGGDHEGVDNSKNRVMKVGSREHERVERNEKSGNGKTVMWVRNRIRVRIISKEFKKGRFYLKKGEVVDVVGPGICDISMDDGKEIVQRVDQDILETALPKRGGPVTVLLGKHKGVYGKLVEKDSEKEMGVVLDADTQDCRR